MEITFAPNGRLQIDDCRIIYRNLSGIGSKFNREGDRNFSVIIPNQDIADELIADGWNVKIKAPREDGDDPFMYLPVKVKFNDRGPNVYLISGKRRTRLNEDTVGMIDDIDISSIDMDLRPYHWEVQGKSGTSAYLEAMQVVQKIDRFGAVDDYPGEAQDSQF